MSKIAKRKNVNGFVVLQDIVGVINAVDRLSQYERVIAQKEKPGLGDELIRLFLWCVAGYQIFKTIDDTYVWISMPNQSHS